jgi:hypothetical protein
VPDTGDVVPKADEEGADEEVAEDGEVKEQQT